MTDSSPASNGPATVKPDAYAALRRPNFSRFVLGSFMGNMGMLMQTTAIGWDLYDRTGRMDSIGMVGLVQILPVMVLTIPAGQVCDLYDRRKVLLLAQAVVVVAAFGLALASLMPGNGPVAWMYACLFVSAIGRAFAGPARSSLFPQLVPREEFPNAVAWSSSTFQLASAVGPAAAGLITWITHNRWPGHSATPVYFIDALFCAFYLGAVYSLDLGPVGPRNAGQSLTIRSLLEGAKFVWSTKLVLMAMTLDLFAVFLGGAVALLPVYAKDILACGPFGLGLMRTATAVGALGMSLAVAHMPPMRNAGRNLLGAIAIFGVATIVFGFSRNYYLSLLMLVVLGASDMISVVVRHTLVQTLTPDTLRGRVTAVNGLFIGMSNELGDFESGFVAQAMSGPFGPIWGTIWTVVGGGFGTVAVVGAVAWISPELRGLKKLTDAKA